MGGRNVVQPNHSIINLLKDEVETQIVKNSEVFSELEKVSLTASQVSFAVLKTKQFSPVSFSMDLIILDISYLFSFSTFGIQEIFVSIAASPVG